MNTYAIYCMYKCRTRLKEKLAFIIFHEFPLVNAHLGFGSPTKY